MLTFRISLLTVLAMHLLSLITAAQLICYHDHYLLKDGFYTVTNVSIPRINDCHAAINMIPSGEYLFDGLHLEKPFYRPPQYRTRKFLIPAIFRSGTCIVAISANPHRPGHDNGEALAPKKAATAMYNVVWPNVRTVATYIVQRCSSAPKAGAKEEHPAVGKKFKGGQIRSSVLIGEGLYSYVVSVRGPPKAMPGDGWTVQLHPEQDHAPSFNVYEAGGESSGRGTKGVWKTQFDQ